MTWGGGIKQKSTALFLWSVVCLVSLGATGIVTPVQAQDKPNIVVIMGDDIEGAPAFFYEVTFENTPGSDKERRKL